ncbi:ATP synthase f chain, mitochondrial precursor [Coemansia sp. RSA 2671]|uniref:ATP synthase f chain, mitochondrial n=2 Tax=Coemansia TaxID=4863 RepID=A0A9W8L2I9_9FUNG|nr:ATP synthase f chain, mitochondrial precursor [Coemansia sp. RSA 2675]KAJ2018358.1 ATP synthase f chain, mitochondrial precursor [Coemansia sp. S85]KAJ2023893.1 ATP synthase f chain, mitochondrial precursor [Coemansia sp. S610]KAJ2349440.1 ATP synthase f chain, mitochondrial precursor [Coemansia sp. RSA 2671]KAJ2380408.1 ATP synthase f chain, mitochondrial precursor [Coemansia sp. RSA 2611]KAJ2399237.1 ATP synthase f chain, mitochondrial precursor [Coemansia sp. RSA 2530]KAJ2683751.1 ATP s
MNAILGRAALKRATAMRNYSSLREIIPPNIAFAARAGESAVEPAAATTLSAQDVSKVVSLYRNLPKGNADAKVVRNGPLARYYNHYFTGDTMSAAPILHVIVGLLVGGYTIHYLKHLKYHKHAENH